MLSEALEGNVFKVKVRKLGASIGITLPPAVLDYADLKEGDYVAIKCEKSKRYGNFVGVGKLQTEDAKEGE